MHPDNLLPLDLDRIALLLDIDGTLLDFAPTPREVWVPPELQNALRILFTRVDGAIAFVSGRSINDIDLIFSPLLFPAIGGHGAEFRPEPLKEAPALPPMPSELKRELATIGKIAPGILVEDKGYAMALHYRLAPDKGPMVEAAVASISARFPAADLNIMHGKLVIEVKPAAHTKATGVRALMRHEPFKGRRPIFIGDDVTDEVVFPILTKYDGLGFAVGRDIPGTNGWFNEPAEVRRWLCRMAEGASQAAEANVGAAG